jgi:hypothetical protein
VAGGIGGDALGGSPVIGGPRGGPGGGIRPPGQGRRGILEGPAVKGAAPGYTATRNEVEDYIRQAAIARGIDPETALKVYRSEGAGAWQSLSRKGGMREPSYGPFQLLKGGPGTGFPMGLGNKAPFDVTDPGTWRQNIDFALNQAVQGGWGPWMGARKQGITGRMGIGPGATPQGITPATPSAPGSGGISGGAPLAGATGPSARHMQGSITMEGQTYRYGSGGAGRGATPPGSYPVNIGRGDIGPIGQRIGSIATVGGLGGTIRDPRFPGSPRLGIQIHASTGARLDQLYSQGCFAVDRRQWPAFRQHLLDLNSRTPGGLRIDVDQDGRAQIVARNQQIVSGGVPTSNFAGGGATGFGTGGAPYSLRSPESAAITRALQTQVNPALTATGQLDVNVRAPRGTVVKASGTGLFTDVHTQRQVQNEESAYGRAESLEVD